MKKGTFYLLILALSALSCINSSLISTIRAENPKINSELSTDGNIIDDELFLPQNAATIYFEFFLDVPENTEVPMNFIWFYKGEVIQTTTNRLPRGNVIVALERNPLIIPKFQKGEYRVEGWYLNTLIVTINFKN